MQFMPSTWARWGVDANGDGVADPEQPDRRDLQRRALPRRLRRTVRHRPRGLLLQPRDLVRERGSRARQRLRPGRRRRSHRLGFAVSQKQLKAQLASARSRVSASHALLGGARAQAAKLARSERRFLRVANTARVLSDQLDARKRAVLLGLRRQAADARVNRLQRRLRRGHDAARQVPERGEQRLLRLERPGAPLEQPVLGRRQLERALQRRRLARDAVPRHPVQVGRRKPGDRLRLLRPRPVRVRAGRHLATALHRLAVELPGRRPGRRRTSCSPATSSSSTGSTTSGSTSATGTSSTRRTPARTSRSTASASGWFASRYDGARRIVGAAVGGSSQTATTTAFTSGSGTSFSSDVVYFTH